MIFMAYEKSAYKNIYDTYEPQKATWQCSSFFSMAMLDYHTG